MPRQFQEAVAFGSDVSQYRLLPFRFLALDAKREVLVNEVGEHLLVPTGTAQQIVRREVDPHSDLYLRLRARQFLFDDQSSPLLDMLATKYRTKKSFLDGFTKLHIFVTTLRCEHSCLYCQVSRQSADRRRYDMSTETAEKALDLMFKSPAPHLTVEFQGGEPLLNFDLDSIYSSSGEAAGGRIGKGVGHRCRDEPGAMATDDMLHYLRDEQIEISTSLDGPAFIHNANRPRPEGNSYELAVQNIGRARDILGPAHVAALMTTTRLSLDYPIEIIDEYVRLGFRSIFLAPDKPIRIRPANAVENRIRNSAFSGVLQERTRSYTGAEPKRN